MIMMVLTLSGLTCVDIHPIILLWRGHHDGTDTIKLTCVDIHPIMLLWRGQW